MGTITIEFLKNLTIQDIEKMEIGQKWKIAKRTKKSLLDKFSHKYLRSKSNISSILRGHSEPDKALVEELDDSLTNVIINYINEIKKEENFISG